MARLSRDGDGKVTSVRRAIALELAVNARHAISSDGLGSRDTGEGNQGSDGCQLACKRQHLHPFVLFCFVFVNKCLSGSRLREEATAFKEDASSSLTDTSTHDAERKDEEGRGVMRRDEEEDKSACC